MSEPNKGCRRGSTHRHNRGHLAELDATLFVAIIPTSPEGVEPEAAVVAVACAQSREYARAVAPNCSLFAGLAAKRLRSSRL